MSKYGPLNTGNTGYKLIVASIYGQITNTTAWNMTRSQCRLTIFMQQEWLCHSMANKMIPLMIKFQEVTNGLLNTLRLRQNGCHFADDPFKCIFLNETLRISIKISLNFVPRGPINNIPAMGQIMAWRRWGDKPLSEPMMVSLLTHICVARPQCFNQKEHSHLQTYLC